MKIVLFGAGEFGQQALNFLGREQVAFFIDNNTSKDGTVVDGILVRSFQFIQNELSNYQIVIAVSHKYLKAIEAQLNACGLKYDTFQRIKMAAVKEKILNRPDFLGIYQRAIEWIKNHNLNGACIINTTTLPIGYPEVTGYYIPTLLTWGYRELATSFGKWLCDIQHEDGSWYDTEGVAPYVFDSGQILKGLVAIKKSMQETGLDFAYTEAELDKRIHKGIEWIFSNLHEDGRLSTPDETDWSDQKRTCSEVIHIYCLQPIMEAARIYNRPDYREKAFKILDYYIEHYLDDILHFGLLSHFYSYVIEALVDLGKTDLARKAMEYTAGLMDEIGFVPAYRDEHWCCSTGLFQQAIIWYKLGNRIRGDKAFEYACKLQNESGGWYGSYINPKYPDEENDYFPHSEISWAVKYFLDALYYKNVADFNAQASIFFQEYPHTDGRYSVIKKEVSHSVQSGAGKVLDVGCGKGAYLHNLIRDVPKGVYTAVDISTNVMGFIRDSEIEQKEGCLTSIPFTDNSFDFTYTTEALEHAVDIESAVREMCRVTKSGGKVVIIDKNITHLGELEIGDWEQWFDVDKLRQELDKYCSETHVDTNVSYEDRSDGLFCAWKGIVK